MMTKSSRSPKKVGFSQMDGLVDQRRDCVWWAGCCDPRLAETASKSLGRQGPFSVAASVAFGALCRLMRWFEHKTQGGDLTKMTGWRKCE